MNILCKCTIDRFGTKRYRRMKLEISAGEAENGFSDGEDDAPCHWRRNYSFLAQVDLNWARNRPRDVLYCNGHKGTVTCLASARQSSICEHGMRFGSIKSIFSGSDDGTIHSWEVPSRLGRNFTSTSFRTQKVHNDKRRMQSTGALDRVAPPALLALAQGTECSFRDSSGTSNLGSLGREPTADGPEWHAYSSERDRKLRRLRSFHGHGGPVWCVKYDERSDTLVSGSYDTTLKIWANSTGTCRRTLRGHSGWVSSLVLLAGRVGATHPPGAGPTAPSALATAVTSSDETESHCAGGVANLLSGSWDSTVRLWDMQRIEVSAGGPLDPCLLACLLARLLACLLACLLELRLILSTSLSPPLPLC
jgi:hypothetical protein